MQIETVCGPLPPVNCVSKILRDTALKFGPEVMQTRKASIHPSGGWPIYARTFVALPIDQPSPSFTAREPPESTLRKALRKAEKGFLAHLTLLKSSRNVLAVDFQENFAPFANSLAIDRRANLLTVSDA